MFKKIFPAIISMVIALSAYANSIIPQPLEIQSKKGRFMVPKFIQYSFSGNCKKEVFYFTKKLEEKFLIKTSPSKDAKVTGFQFDLDGTKINVYGKEGYKLVVNENGVRVFAASPTGIFYAIQSVIQLIKTSKSGYFFSCVEIFDKPRFLWRSFLLDEARSFKGTATVKKLLEEMAFLKMNVFHWHLTDDQGWRIQILKYPLLTSKSSGPVTAVVGKLFYTQEEIRDIVAYASDRHILVIPEIEMPGHASAAIAAYPNLGVAKKPITMPVGQGIFKNIFDVSDTLVVSFIHDVLDEVMPLFSSKIIHIGGDEVKYDSWENSEHVPAFMKQKELSPSGLQLWFLNGISQYLHSKGFKMMGWNDMLGKQHDDVENIVVGKGLAPDAIIHFWLGSPQLINKAASAGFNVVNSFHEFTYLDYSYKSISLKKSYSFDPVPASVGSVLSEKILGLGCQMWGEHIPTVEKMYYQVFPRIAAYAEVGWTNVANRDFNRFKKSLQKLIVHWKEIGIVVDQNRIQ